MNRLLEETKTLAHSLRNDHGGDEAAMACVSYLSRHYLTHLGDHHRTDMTPLINLLDAALVSYANVNRLEVVLFRRAVGRLDQAGKTLSYMATYPDTVF